MIEYDAYLEMVKEKYQASQFISELNAYEFYEDQFELAWLATKLKQYTYVTLQDNVKVEDIQTYSKNCMKYSLKNYKGLRRGLQVGVVSFHVMVGYQIDKEAITWVLQQPKKHFAAFEMPILIDLTAEQVYFYPSTPLWGAIYYKHFREYIMSHLRIMKED